MAISWLRYSMSNIMKLFKKITVYSSQSDNIFEKCVFVLCTEGNKNFLKILKLEDIEICTIIESLILMSAIVEITINEVQPNRSEEFQEKFIPLIVENIMKFENKHKTYIDTYVFYLNRASGYRRDIKMFLFDDSFNTFVGSYSIAFALLRKQKEFNETDEKGAHKAFNSMEFRPILKIYIEYITSIIGLIIINKEKIMEGLSNKTLMNYNKIFKKLKKLPEFNILFS